MRVCESNCCCCCLLVKLGNNDGSSSIHLQFSVPACQSDPQTHTHKHCVPTWHCMVRVGSRIPSLLLFCIYKGRVNESFCFHSEGVIYFLSFCPPLSITHTLFLFNRMTVLIISIPSSPHSPPHVRLSLTLHPLNQTSRQADLFTGVHSVLKHHWMLGGWGGGVLQSSWEWIHDT